MKQKLRSVLLIEDNELTNIFNKKLISNLDIVEDVFVSENVEEALKFLGTKIRSTNGQLHYPEPDIIFLDINMPGMNGWEFLEEYKKLNRTGLKSAKIVMLTTSPNPDDEQRAGSIPEIIAFKRKPLTKIVLHEILAEHFSAFL